MLGIVKTLIEQGSAGTFDQGLDLERKGFMDFLRKSGILNM
jgi:hypothetical protein